MIVRATSWLDWPIPLREPVLWMGDEHAALRAAIETRVAVHRDRNHARRTARRTRRFPTVLVVHIGESERTSIQVGNGGEVFDATAIEAEWNDVERFATDDAARHWLLPHPFAIRRGNMFGPAERGWLAARAASEQREFREAVFPALGAVVVSIGGEPVVSKRPNRGRAQAGNAPRVSAVLVTHGQRPRMLREALESVLGQSRPPFEILIAEDGRSPETADLVRAHRGRVRVLPGEAGSYRGQAATMNRAIEAATGTHLAWLDDDDRWAPRKLELQLARLGARPEVSVLGTRYAVQDAESRTQTVAPLPPLDRFPAARCLLHGSLLCGPSAVVAAGLYREVGGYDESLLRLADYDFWVRALARPIELLEAPLTWVRAHEGNRRGPEVESRILVAARVIHGRLRARVDLDAMFPEIEATAELAERRRVRSRALLERGAAALRVGEEDLARRDFESARAGLEVEARLALGSLELRAWNLDVAATHFESAARLGSRELRSSLGLGLVAARRQRWSEAEQYFADALRIDPLDPVARANLVVHRFRVPGLASPLEAEVAALVRDLLARLRPRSLAFSLIEVGESLLERPFGL